MGKAKFYTPPSQNPLTNLGGDSNISLRPPRELDVQNLVEVHSAVMNLRMREKKNEFSCGFFVSYPSISFFVGATSRIFGRFKRRMAQTTCFRNHWCLLWVSIIHINI